MFSYRTHWNLEQNRLSRMLAQVRASQQRIFDLTRSNPTECGFVYDQKGMQSVFAHPEILQYQPAPLGILSAREAVSLYYQAQKVSLTPDDLLAEWRAPTTP